MADTATRQPPRVRRRRRRASRRWSSRRRRGGPTDRRRPNRRRPDASAGARVGPDAERPDDVVRALVSIELELRDRRPVPLERADEWQAQPRRGDLGDRAPPGRSRAGARDRHGRARGRRPWRPTPTRLHRRATASPRGTARRRSPAYLSWCRAPRTGPANGAHHSSWSNGNGRSAGQADRCPASKLEPSVQRRPASGAQRFTFETTPGTRGREGQVQGGRRDAGETPQDRHGRSWRGALHRHVSGELPRRRRRDLSRRAAP